MYAALLANVSEPQPSVRENVLHLRDIDIEEYEKRVVRVLAEDHPFLPDVDGAQLARERDYKNQPLQPALDAVTLGRLLELWLEHDEDHVKQIEALLGAAD